MPGTRQHYLAAPVIGGFGRAAAGKALHEGSVVARDLRTGSNQNERRQQARLIVELPCKGRPQIRRLRVCLRAAP